MLRLESSEKTTRDMHGDPLELGKQTLTQFGQSVRRHSWAREQADQPTSEGQRRSLELFHQLRFARRTQLSIYATLQ